MWRVSIYFLSRISPKIFIYWSLSSLIFGDGPSKISDQVLLSLVESSGRNISIGLSLVTVT